MSKRLKAKCLEIDAEGGGRRRGWSDTVESRGNELRGWKRSVMGRVLLGFEGQFSVSLFSEI